jgi:hypothetical protein
MVENLGKYAILASGGLVWGVELALKGEVTLIHEKE